MKNFVVAIVEARMSSSRLPRKTLTDIAGKTLLERVILRLKMSKTIDKIVVATSTNESDDEIVSHCNKLAVPFYRGSELDVLERVNEASVSNCATVVVQCGADCPFYDPKIIDLLVSSLLFGGYSYAANDMKLTYPEGVDGHIILAKALADSAQLAQRADERSDTPRYIWNNPDEYPIFSLEAVPKSYYNRPEIRLTVDYPEDLLLCRKIYESFGGRSDFSTSEVIDLLDKNPEWLKINAGCEQHSAAYVVGN